MPNPDQTLAPNPTRISDGKLVRFEVDGGYRLGRLIYVSSNYGHQEHVVIDQHTGLVHVLMHWEFKEVAERTDDTGAARNTGEIGNE